MKLKQLIYFAAVAEHGSFNGASKALYVAQSSMSTTVAELESELGFDLFVRSRKGVKLTGMGEIVYANIKDLLKVVDNYGKEWQQIYSQRAAINMPVVAAVVPSLYPFFMKYVVEDMKTDYPNLKIAVFEGRGELLHNYILSGKVDIIFSDCIEKLYPAEKQSLLDSGFLVNEIGNDMYKVALKNRHDERKSNGDTITKAEISKMTFACYSGGDAAADEFIARGVDPDRLVEYNSIEKIYQAVISGNCAGCLPEGASLVNGLLDRKNPEVRFVTLDGYGVPFVHFGCHRNDGDICRVYDILEERFRKLLEQALEQK